MGRGVPGVARIAYAPQGLSGVNRFSGLYPLFVQVSVENKGAICQPEPDLPAPFPALVDAFDGTIRYSEHCRAPSGFDVYPFVPTAPAWGSKAGNHIPGAFARNGETINHAPLIDRVALSGCYYSPMRFFLHFVRMPVRAPTVDQRPKSYPKQQKIA